MLSSVVGGCEHCRHLERRYQGVWLEVHGESCIAPSGFSKMNRKSAHHGCRNAERVRQHRSLTQIFRHLLVAESCCRGLR